MVMAVILVATFGWAAMEAQPGIGFAVVSPSLQVGVEAAGAVIRLFAALVLFLLPTKRHPYRVRWMALGLLILGIGNVIFGYIHPTFQVGASVNSALYGSVLTRAIAGLCFLLGLLPRPPRLPTRAAVIAGGAVFIGMGMVLPLLAGHLPELSRPVNLIVAARQNIFPFPGLTVWYWTLGSIPLLLTGAAMLLAANDVRDGGVGSWLAVAMTLLFGSELHGMLWPSIYSPVVTTADILRFGFTLAVAGESVIALTRIAEYRGAMLEAEQEQNRRLSDMEVLRRNFSAMVGHELGSPVAALGRVVELLRTDRLDRDRAATMMRNELDLLETLIADVQSAGRAEAADFHSMLEPVRLSSLVADAAAYARALPGDHPVLVDTAGDTWVQADAERISQVLRNLLSNAAKFADEGTPIEIRAHLEQERVGIEVHDSGAGIAPEDVDRIFEKFGRGRNATQSKTPGTGLGLYLSRRIVRAHGSDLTVSSRPGDGATFRFDLAVTSAPEAARDLQEIRLVLVDDHVSYREALALALQSSPPMVLAGQAGTMEEARELLPLADVLILDLDLPDGSGDELISSLNGAESAPRVLVLSASTQPTDLARAIEAGAAGVLHKSVGIDQILHAIRQVAAGETTLSPGDTVELLRAAARERDEERAVLSALKQLTRREHEVLDLIVEGMTDKEIAARLHITTATAQTHVANLLGKLGVRSRLQAAMLATRAQGSEA
jgi:signal transduction histidine kinase/DNA-binding NarL/FixJ family response regulator